VLADKCAGTALIAAAGGCHASVVKLLLDAKADVNLTDTVRNFVMFVSSVLTSTRFLFHVNLRCCNMLQFDVAAEYFPHRFRMAQQRLCGLLIEVTHQW
jgi:hypothetical protein